MAWVTRRIKMQVSDKDKEALEVESGEEVKKIPVERRKKGPFEVFQGATGAGGLGVSVLILNMLIQQGDTQKDHTQWIHDNTRTTQKIEQMLQQIQDEFKGDIARFELEHARLKQEMHSLILRQEGTAVRMQGMEGSLQKIDGVSVSTLRNYDAEIRAWADNRFEPKAKK